MQHTHTDFLFAYWVRARFFAQDQAFQGAFDSGVDGFLDTQRADVGRLCAYQPAAEYVCEQLVAHDQRLARGQAQLLDRAAADERQGLATVGKYRHAYRFCQRR